MQCESWGGGVHLYSKITAREKRRTKQKAKERTYDIYDRRKERKRTDEHERMTSCQTVD